MEVTVIQIYLLLGHEKHHSFQVPWFMYKTEAITCDSFWTDEQKHVMHACAQLQRQEQEKETKT